jgi:carbonic anhydrase
MDGRIQLPVIKYLQKRFDAQYVDSITEAGPNLILSQQKRTGSVQAILERLKISVENHNSAGIAVVGHHDCAGNPATQGDQITHIHKAIEFLRQHYPDLEIVALWVDGNWEIHEVAAAASRQCS